MAGKNGGARPGAGRPVGALSHKTQELLDRVMSEGISPMDVLLNDMRLFYSLGENKMLEAANTKAGKAQATAFRAACSLKDIARSCARDVAPYIHPKLASLQANVNVTNVEAQLAELE